MQALERMWVLEWMRGGRDAATGDAGTAAQKLTKYWPKATKNKFSKAGKVAPKLFKVAKNRQKLLKHPRSSKKKTKMQKGPILAKSGQKSIKVDKSRRKEGPECPEAARSSQRPNVTKIDQSSIKGTKVAKSGQSRQPRSKKGH